MKRMDGWIRGLVMMMMKGEAGDGSEAWCGKASVCWDAGPDSFA